MAIEVLNSYMRTLEKDRPRPTYNESEMIMLKALLLEKSGNIEGCLKLLEDSKDDIMDVVARREKRGELLLRLGKWDEACQAYKDMIDVNPDHYAYHRGLEVSIPCFSFDFQRREQRRLATTRTFLPRLAGE